MSSPARSAPTAVREARPGWWLAAVLAVVAVSILLRLPVLTWPLAERTDAHCCGHPDEITHSDLLQALLAGTDPGSYPPGLAFATSLVLRSPAGPALGRLFPEGRRPEERQRVRAVAIARTISLVGSVIGVFLLYAVARQLGLAPWLAAPASATLALAPLYALHGAFGLADVPLVALLLGSVAAYLSWHRRPRLRAEIVFGLLLGGVFAFKIVAAVIGAPPLVSMVVRSRARLRTAAATLLSLLAGVFAFSGGHVRFGSPSSMFREVVVANAAQARVRPGWNAAHHLLSLVPGMGLLFVLIAIAVVLSVFLRRRRGRGSIRQARVLEPLPALAAGAFLYFAGICFSSNPFTRHMLPLYPFLVLFVAIGAGSLTATVRRGVAAAAFLAIAAYGTFAALPVLRSYAADPVERASAWVRAETGFDGRFPPYRNFLPVPSRRSGRGLAAAEAPSELLIVHSDWVGRLTGRWWLKPAPVDLADVYHFGGTLDELRFWQEVMSGRSREWRVIRSFGEEWRTPERLFLTWMGRGYDQFVGAGRADVVARFAPEIGPAPERRVISPRRKGA